jgi:hypothetical protein
MQKITPCGVTTSEFQRPLFMVVVAWNPHGHQIWIDTRAYRREETGFEIAGGSWYSE